MATLRVRDWAANFENHRTRELRTLTWIPVPVKLDGDGYAEILDHPAGAAHFGTWVALLEVAAKCEVRGSFIRQSNTENRRPHDLPALSRLTRIPLEILSEAVERLVAVGWLEWVPDEREPSTAEREESRANAAQIPRQRRADPAPTPRQPGDSPRNTAPTLHKNREEGRREEERVGQGSPADSSGISISEPTQTSIYAPSPPEDADSPPPSVAVWIPIVGKIPKTLKHGPVREEPGGWEAGVTEDRLAELVPLYPGVDVRVQLLRARDWCFRKPDRRKTYGGFQDFIAKWLSNEQNGRSNGNGSSAGGLPSQQPGLTHDQIRRRSGAPPDWKEQLREREKDIVPWSWKDAQKQKEQAGE